MTSDAAVTGAAAMAAPLRVLVVDDNVVNQTLARALLQRAGHAVTVALNGQEAVDIVTRSAFDLVLMDVNMPVLDGLAATRRIREREQDGGGHLPIIALTAGGPGADSVACLTAGMDVYLAKPVRADLLFAAIERVVHAPRRVAAIPIP